MPSPLGHALAGAAAGWACAGSRAGRSSSLGRLWGQGALFAALAVLPDFDLLTAVHRGATHSLAAAAVAGAIVAGVTRDRWLGIAAACAYATHVLLDWLGSDSSFPIGIMALWPVSREYYESDLHLFDAISRRYWLPGFWTHNVRAVLRELVILVPFVVIAFLRRQRDHVPAPVTCLEQQKGRTGESKNQYR